MVHTAHSRKAAGAQQVKPFKSSQLLPNDALLVLHMWFWLRLICTITEPQRHDYHHFEYLIQCHLNNKRRVAETLMSQTVVLKVQSLNQSVDFEATKVNESGGDEFWVWVRMSWLTLRGAEILFSLTYCRLHNNISPWTNCTLHLPSLMPML